jgi:SAM-dependent methyltransferase
MKPVIDFNFRAVNNPAKNYFFNLLYQDIAAVRPARALDAGMGRLRNYWMFPGKYVGIGRHKIPAMQGIELPEHVAMMQERGIPELYLMLLESDFSFLGEFDLCVSTFTLCYAKDSVDVVSRLAERLRPGGSLLFQDTLEKTEQYLKALAPHFEHVEAIYWGMANTNFFMEPFVKPEFSALQRQEMEAPNTPEGHSDVYIRATGKRTGAAPAAPVPEIVIDGLLRLVAADIPQLVLE